MKLVADANVLFAALLKKGFTRRLWFNPELSLYAPEFIAKEFLSKKGELLQKIGSEEAELDFELARLLKHATLVSDDDLKDLAPIAAKLTPDAKDWAYLAAALHVGADVWTNDKQYARQSRVRIWTTIELARHLFA